MKVGRYEKYSSNLSTLDSMVQNMQKKERYKIHVSKVILNRVAERILKNLFSATTCVMT